MYDVLLTGAETHQGMIVIRSLAKRGVKMLVTGPGPNSIGFHSKYIAGKAVLPSAETEKEAFVDRLLELIEQYKIPYIFPVTETSLIPLDEQRQRVDSVARLMAPPSDVIRAGMDKKVQIDTALKLDIPTTETLYPESIEEAEDFAERVSYPVIFKPQGRASDSKVKGNFNFKVHYCHTPAQLQDFLGALSDHVYPMMQSYAYGQHNQFSCFVENGKDVHSCFQDEMTRMLPITGGVGARRLSCPIAPEILDYSTRFFQELNWEGVAQTQWKGPGPDGKYRFIEVSVRIIASIGSPVFSGVDLPWMHYQYYTGQKVDRANSFVIGKHSRWFRGDAITVTRHLLGDQPKSADKLPSKISVLGSWLYDFVRPGLDNDVEALSDPIPGLIELKSLVFDLWRILLNRVAAWLPILGKIKRKLSGRN